MEYKLEQLIVQILHHLQHVHRLYQLNKNIQHHLQHVHPPLSTKQKYTAPPPSYPPKNPPDYNHRTPEWKKWYDSIPSANAKIVSDPVELAMIGLESDLYELEQLDKNLDRIMKTFNKEKQVKINYVPNKNQLGYQLKKFTNKLNKVSIKIQKIKKLSDNKMLKATNSLKKINNLYNI